MAKVALYSKPKERERQAEMQAVRSLTDKAYELVEEMIVTLKLPPGSAISELVLSKRLGMSRTPVGEALQRLAREGLVMILPRRGIIVSDLNAKQQLHLLEMRREIDRFIARSAARRASEEERHQFQEIADTFEASAKTGDEKTFMRADKAFHSLFALASRNEFAMSALDLMDSLSRRFWYAHHKQAGDLQLSGKYHADIASAIALGDEAGAAAASDKLMDYLQDFTKATLSLDI
jgi:DNA-binding GntR family transcriptional regulator